MSTDPRVDLLAELAHPVRLRVIDRLGQAGPATVSRLAQELDVPLPLLSNHLRRLREARLVNVERAGRHAVYSLADPGLEALTGVLDRVAGRVAPRPDVPDTAFGRARTCYDHLAGRLGVELYRSLLERGAVRDRPDGTVELGPRADEAFRELGVEVAAVDPGRRRFAFECLDATERAPHLGGALGAAVAHGAVAAGWVKPTGDRVLDVAGGSPLTQGRRASAARRPAGRRPPRSAPA
jgi:DNA-binding transcriptional ArsR family regulator